MQFSTADVETICRALLGAPNGALSSKTNWRYGKHGSLSIDIKKATWFDWEIGRGGGILDLIARETGKIGKDAIAWLASNGLGGDPSIAWLKRYGKARQSQHNIIARLEELGCSAERNTGLRLGDSQTKTGAGNAGRCPAEPDPARLKEDDGTRTAQALSLWRQGVDALGTIVGVYLRSRGLTLPGDIAGATVRFLPRCRMGEDEYPVMLTLIRNIWTDRAQAVQRTAILPDGSDRVRRADGKTHRMTLGPTRDGVIKIDPDAAIVAELAIGEGFESCLAGRQLGLGPVWAAVSSGGLAKFPPLPGVQKLRILGENDKTNINARNECGRRWIAAGREVRVVKSKLGNDLNDALMSGD